MEEKEKFILELENEPTLVFVQNGAGSDFKLYQDGEEVKGIRSVRIYADWYNPTTHEVEYLTGKTK